MQLEKSHLEFIADIKNQIKSAQYRALQKVNAEQVNLNWNIGKTILERQKEFGWGKSIVEILAAELQTEFVGVDGLSARNLWRMRTLVDQYHQSTLILPPLVAEIPWTQVSENHIVEGDIEIRFKIRFISGNQRSILFIFY